MTDEDKSWHSTISLGIGIAIGLGVAFLILKIVSESQKQQQLSMQNLQTTALLQSGYGLYGLQMPIQTQTAIPQGPTYDPQITTAIPQGPTYDPQIYQQAPMPLQTSVANYDNEETYHALRDDNGFLLDVKVKRNAKVK